MRAMKGGIKEIGLGVLYGIGDWFKDTLAMIEHANKLIEYNPEINIRFSFPRIQFSSNQCVDIVRQSKGKYVNKNHRRYTFAFSHFEISINSARITEL